MLSCLLNGRNEKPARKLSASQWVGGYVKEARSSRVQPAKTATLRRDRNPHSFSRALAPITLSAYSSSSSALAYWKMSRDKKKKGWGGQRRAMARDCWGRVTIFRPPFMVFRGERPIIYHFELFSRFVWARREFRNVLFFFCWKIKFVGVNIYWEKCRFWRARFDWLFHFQMDFNEWAAKFWNLL